MTGPVRTAIIVFILLVRISHAQIGVSPPRFEFEIDSTPSTHSLRLFNYGNMPVTVAVTVHNWDLDENNDVRILPPTEQSLDQWIVLNPLRFTVEGGRSQTVRFAVRPKVEPLPGEHRAIIYFQEQRSTGDNTAFQVVFRLGVAVYGFAGDVLRAGRLNDITVDENGAEFDVSSTGTAHIRFNGQYAIWSAVEYPGAERTEKRDDPDAETIPLPQGMVHAGYLPTTPFLPETRRTLTVSFTESLPDGSYIFDVNATLGTAVVDTGIGFTVQGDQTAPADSLE